MTVFQGRYLYDTYGVHLSGVVVDTGGDASVLWGSTEFYQELMETTDASAQQQLRDLEHRYGCVPFGMKTAFTLTSDAQDDGNKAPWGIGHEYRGPGPR
jgi:hypothetical protein